MCNQKTGQSDIKLSGHDKKTERQPITKRSNGKRDAARDEASLIASRVSDTDGYKEQLVCVLLI